MKKGFTLIELLIVVAIIAILAAIAVPNFLEAQVRSKVSRSKADIRTLTTALEAYKIDQNAGPTDAGNGAQLIYRPYSNPPGSATTDPNPNYSIGYELTTPIAYLSSAAAMVDVFKITDQYKYENDPTLRGRQYYNFTNVGYRKKFVGQPGAISAAAVAIIESFIGEWMIMGAGPDKYVNNRPPGSAGTGIENRDFSSANIPRCIPYDATNGTVSNGDIYRSHKYSDNQAIRLGVQ